MENISHKPYAIAFYAELILNVTHRKYRSSVYSGGDEDSTMPTKCTCTLTLTLVDQRRHSGRCNVLRVRGFLCVRCRMEEGKRAEGVRIGAAISQERNGDHHLTTHTPSADRRRASLNSKCAFAIAIRNIHCATGRRVTTCKRTYGLNLKSIENCVDLTNVYVTATSTCRCQMALLCCMTNQPYTFLER